MLNSDRKGSFLRKSRSKEKEHGIEAGVFSDLIDVWVLFS